MSQKIMSENIDVFFDKAGQWKEIFSKLRQLFLDAGLEEEFKWGRACYTSGGKNIAVLQGFKNYCAVMFFKGVLMNDPDGLLIQITENKQAERQLRFTCEAQFDDGLNKAIRKYINEAVRVEESGEKVELRKTDDYPIPDELTEVFEADPSFDEAFHKLTPGRQRGYLLHFAGARQPATRTARIEKYRDKIFDGLGLMDR